MKESSRALLLFGVSALVLVISYVFFLQPFMSEQPKVRDVINANSTWSVTMQEYELTGPLSEETYRLSNDNGKTTMFYAATNRAGTVTKEFSVPLIGPEGTFLFEELRADGIWEIDNKPVLPHAKDEYIIEIDQTLGDEGGTRSFGFSDPHYWATTHAQEIKLSLPPKGASATAPIVGAAGRKLQDPRYLQIVAAVKNFGPYTVRAAEARIRAELMATIQHPIAPK